MKQSIVTAILAKKINMHGALVWRVAAWPTKNMSLAVIIGKNLPVYGHRWACRKLDTGYYFLHLGPVAFTIRHGERATMADNGMYHKLTVGPLMLGLHGK